MGCVDRRRTIVLRQPMMTTGFLTVQLNPHLVERCKPSLRTLTHAFPVLDFLLDKRGVHAIWDLVHGDVAVVEGLRPEDISINGDVVDVRETVVWNRGDGDALAAVGLDVEFVGGLAGAPVTFHIGFLIGRGTFRVEMCPNPCRCGGCYGAREAEEQKSDLLYLLAWVAGRNWLKMLTYTWQLHIVE